MRKVVSIAMVFMMLLSVVNLTVVSHFCQGNITAVKVSVYNQKSLSCGMEDHSTSSPTGKSFKKHCCENESASLKVDSNYSPSYSKSLDVFQKEIHHAGILFSEVFRPVVLASKTLHPLSPPDIVPIRSVEQASICVFRI
jgi:hypothetical protein